MFLQNEAGTQGDGKSLKGAYDEFKKTLKGLSDDLLAFDTQARKVVGDTFGQGVVYADKIRVTIASAVKNTAELGYTTEQYASLLSQISTNLQTNLDLSTAQLENFMLFADAASISAEEVGKLVVGFQDIGVGAEGALNEMEGMAKTARGYGVNVSQYMGVMAENLKLMNQYKFQNGVEGLASMVAKSQALRININTVTSLAEKFLDPEGAIDAAASLQMMGGELAKLGDGFQLMNLAQNDVEGLFDALVEATSASVSFNEENGQFELSALEMRRLRATAKELGVDYNELAKGAINFAERQEKLSQLDFMPGINEEDKEFFASVGQLDKTGELKFSVKRGDQEVLVSATELTNDEIKGLRQQQIDDAATSKDIAIQQRDLLTKLYNEATETRKVITAEGALKEGGTFDNLKKSLDDFGVAMKTSTEKALNSDVLQRVTATAVSGLTFAADNMSLAATTLTTGLANLYNNLTSGGGQFEMDSDDSILGPVKGKKPGYSRKMFGPEGIISFNDKDTIVAGTDLMGGNEDRNTEQIMGNLPKEFANVLQNNLSNVESPKISFEDLQITHSGSIRLEGDGRFLTLDMLANNPQMLENLTNMIKQRMSQTSGY